MVTQHALDYLWAKVTVKLDQSEAAVVQWMHFILL